VTPRRPGTRLPTPAEAVIGPAAVVVNHDAGEALVACVASLAADGAGTVLVVDNASGDDSVDRLRTALPGAGVLRCQRNLGYGAGANRGIAATAGDVVVVTNPDVVVHPGAIAALVQALEADPTLAIVGPRISEPDGSRYPSARRFPSPRDAVGHVLLGTLAPGNHFSRRYRMEEDVPPSGRVDWVSGACLAARRSALEELGGFDEAYFMYAEDMDLCWRAHQAGWAVAYVPEAEVTHLRGLSTGRRPYRMLAAHHRSALRFASRVETGWRRPLLVPAALLLGLRLVVEATRLALSGPSPTSQRRSPTPRAAE
jgi:N-acetylglucosaminyl-diphospho-decaprenol L-rhamnosyltransferase